MSPMRRADYAHDWEQKSQDIRFGRAAGRCECRNECGTGHEDRCEATHGQPHPVSGKVVWLQTAHLDRNTRNNDPPNLLAMCAPCHLAYDLDQHLETAAWTRAGRPPQQLALFTVTGSAT